MLPHQREKVDISSLNEEEQKLFRLYGKLPNRKDLLANKLKERKYFDSGDYALSKAGRAPKQSVGTTIPNPDMVPHAATAQNGTPPIQIPGQSASPPGHSAPIGIPEGNASSPTSQSNRLSASMGGGVFGASPSRSSFPTATGVHAGSPGREPTSSLAREQVPDSSNDMVEG
ncbi:uncharacterized protein MJAP1_001444 [Malassezia japonica]|uniref:mRNA stability protein n=1 Tax=Malassezia japonica TaxID=223818 RepID=A0AAF0JF11_9BASI|nr:uncharacterized protein MJAP1_001444 [Malassezia japonica]WFD38491.1 hypothetical protein MJAP1_001444 [Malassezia japonica]